jgi:hypothetical protein
MKSPFYRPLLALAMALSLASCGGKATFEIKGEIAGLVYDGLTLTETVSGATLAVAKGSTTFKFPNSIEYGTPYDVKIVAGTASNQPEHQACTVIGGTDTAGRMAQINIGVSCAVLTHDLGGAITVTGGGSPAGLTLNNGTRPAFVAVAASNAYVFGAIPYGTSYGLIITTQPTDPKPRCVLSTAVVPATGTTGMSSDNTSFASLMGDTDAKVDVVCTTTP